MNDHDDTRIKAHKDYDQALRRAFWRKLRHGLKRGCNDLLPAGQVFQHLNLRKRYELGLQDVPIDRHCR